MVGAGHNGLTAGALLARAGLSTLVLERRDVVGGCCVTEEIAPGCRASTTSYIASMLRPEVIRELDLGSHGLRMVPCEPALQVALDGGEVVAELERPRPDRRGDRAVLARRCPLVPGRRRGAEGAGRPAAAHVTWSCPPTPGPPACAAAASCCGSAGGCAGCAGASSRA